MSCSKFGTSKDIVFSYIARKVDLNFSLKNNEKVEKEEILKNLLLTTHVNFDFFQKL